MDDTHPNAHHDRVYHSYVSLKRYFTILGDVAKSHKHVSSGDADLIEGAPSIVFGLVANFWSEITTFNARTDFPGFNISDLNHEWLHS